MSYVSRSSPALESILNMPGLEPGTTQLSMAGGCAYHLRYTPVDPSAHTHSISGPGPSGRPLLTLILNVQFSVRSLILLDGKLFEKKIIVERKFSKCFFI